MTTNYERIKNMTVDEMADFMDYIGTQSPCDKYCKTVFEDIPNACEKGLDSISDMIDKFLD